MATLSATCSFIVFLIAQLASYKCCAKIPAGKTDHEVFEPIHLNTGLRRDSSTKNKDGHFLQTSYLIQTKSKTFHVELHLNRGLLHPDYVSSFQGPDGTSFSVKNTENCFYHGAVRGKRDTFVAMSTCIGLRGVIHDEDGEHYGIEPLNSDLEEVSEKHILFNMRKIGNKQMKCGANETGYKTHFDVPIHNHFDVPMQGYHFMNKVRRDISSIGRIYISLALVVDKRLFIRLGRKKKVAILRAKEIANYVDGIYKSIGIRVPLILVEVWDRFDKVFVTSSPGDLLIRFEQYSFHVLRRGENYKIDNAQLLSGIDFTDAVVGTAGLGNICSYASAGVVQDLSSAQAAASTVAHEIGHNLGLSHNDPSCVCPVEPCVMSRYASYKLPKGLSTCSKTALEKLMRSGQALCLFDPPSKLFGEAVCGNGFVEEEEECDCGTEEQCAKSDECCDGKTCKLRSNAQCAIGPCCSNCQLENQGTLCRGVGVDCDLPEYCNGRSAWCPSDVYKHDGTPCNKNQGYCFGGKCRSYDGQCEFVWGKGARKAADVCYEKLNQRGSRYGNCGLDRYGKYVACQEENAQCGKLFCQNVTNPNPRMGYVDTVIIISYKIKGEWLKCRSPSVIVPRDIEDPSLVLEGTKCGPGKICHNHACVNLSALHFMESCQPKCQNGGVCNNKGHCHCKIGYAWPDCFYPGEGGSEDSGQRRLHLQAEKEKLGESGKIVIVVVFALIPVVTLTAFFGWKYRHGVTMYFKRQTEPNELIPDFTEPDALEGPSETSRSSAIVSLTSKRKKAQSFARNNAIRYKASHPSDGKMLTETVKFAAFNHASDFNGVLSPYKSPQCSPKPSISNFFEPSLQRLQEAFQLQSAHVLPQHGHQISPQLSPLGSPTHSQQYPMPVSIHSVPQNSPEVSPQSSARASIQDLAPTPHPSVKNMASIPPSV